MRFIYPILGVGGVVAVSSLASCGLLSGSQPQAAQPVIVTNNIPSGSDSGITVLLTITGIAAFMLLAAAIAAIAWALHERKYRKNAELVVEHAYGRPISQLGLAGLAPISPERLPTMAAPLPVYERRMELQR